MTTKKKNNLRVLVDEIVDEGTKVLNLSNSVRITEAHIKDEFCHYSYEILSGIGRGDTHKVKGTGIIDRSMGIAFSALNPHLACIDDIFKHAGVKVKNIDSMKGDEYTQLYEVTGFKIKGAAENESVILVGTKHVTEGGGRMELNGTPQIPLSGSSSYTWYNELRDAVELARNEVDEYRNGKCTAPQEEEQDPKQMKLYDANPESNKQEGEDEFLNSGKVEDKK